MDYSTLSDSELKELLDLLEAEIWTPPSLLEYCESTVNFELHDWQKIHLIPLLDSLAHKKGQRILIHAPPQFGKSVILSQRFIAWLLGVHPLHRVRLACYNISKAAGFGTVVRHLMKSPEFIGRFQEESHLPKVAAADLFFTNARKALNDSQASFMALGLETGFTGTGVDTLIIDDPYPSAGQALSETYNKALWRFWTDTAKPRLNEDTNVIVMFHRYQENDLAGRLLAEGGWDYYRFPAIADGNEDLSDPTGRAEGEVLSPMRTLQWLEDLRDKDPRTFLGQFQGRPRPVEGAVIKREWLKTETLIPPIDRVVRFWDLATSAKRSGDFTAGALVGVGDDQTMYLLDVVRFRAEWADACEIIANVTQQDFINSQILRQHYSVGLEEVAWQRPMISDLFAHKTFKSIQLLPIKPKGDKKERASGWITRARFDKFRLLTGAWNDDFINEAITFDGLDTSHDDQIDAISGAYELVWQLKGGFVQPPEEIKYGTWAYFDELDRIVREQKGYDDDNISEEQTEFDFDNEDGYSDWL